jgi:hypothetical protein
MMAIGFALIAWHVWTFGPSGHTAGHTGENEAVKGSFLTMLAAELWNLLIDKHGILAELWDIFPYFIIGILLAGYIRTYKIAVKLQLTLRKYGAMSVFVASFIGIITPLCACGTLTTAISLLFAGIPLAPVMSLMVTSSLMSPSTYLLTLNDLGSEWTVVRTLAALLMGVFAGMVTHFLRRWGFETKEVFIDGAIVRGDFHDEDYPDERLRCGCKQKFGNRIALKTSNMFLIFLAKSSEMLWMVGKYILVGVIIGAIAERYMPTEWIYYFFGRKDPLNVVWITLASVPMFLHQLSASSILFHIKSSLNGTLDSSAALAFMIGGPVTAMPTMVMFWTIFRKKVFVLYMLICLVGTVLVTYSIQALFFVPGIDTGNALLKGINSLAGGNSAIISKSGESVRIVMDPVGKPLVATYTTLLGNEGGVVFDAGPARFTAASSSATDGSRYINNIADWLEQNSSAAAQGNILLYDISGGMQNRLAPALQGTRLADLDFTYTNRTATPAISARLLEKQSQLWLITGKGGELSEAERQAILAFSRNGGSLLLVAADPTDTAAINSISSRFGVTFSGSTDSGSKIPVAVAAPMFYRAAEMIGKLLKFTGKA